VFSVLVGGASLLVMAACSSNDNLPSFSNGGASGGVLAGAGVGGSTAGAAGNATTSNGGSAGVGNPTTSAGVGGTSASGGAADTSGASGTLNAMGGATSAGVAGVGGRAVGAGGRAGANAGTSGGGSTSIAGGGSATGGAGGASSALVYPPAAGTGDVVAGVEQLNRYRATLGLSSVTLDEASSTGCSGHLDYLIEEAETRGQMGYLEHTESNTSNSHYSAANEQAGKQSDIAWGQRGGRGNAVGQSFGQAVDLWINGLYHRHPLLDPGLVKVGGASKQGYNCMNYGAAGNTTVLKPASAVLWPADGMTDVPRTFPGNEGPCPTVPADPLNATSCDGSGFIISATFYNWGSNRTSAIGAVTSVVLTNTSTNMPVPLLTWYADRVADHDPARGYTPDEIALVPAASLAQSTTFRVDIDATVSGNATKLSWSFTTGTRNQ
jgi:hypothetical protein